MRGTFCSTERGTRSTGFIRGQGDAGVRSIWRPRRSAAATDKEVCPVAAEEDHAIEA